MRNGLPSFRKTGHKRSSYEEIAKCILEYWHSIRTSTIISGYYVTDIVIIKEWYDENANSS